MKQSKKKFVVIIVNNSISELDWLLPLLYLLKNNFYIFVYFKNLKIYRSLKDNKVNFLLFQKIIDYYFVDKFQNLFFYKFFNKLLRIYSLNSSLGINLEKKIHNLKRLEDIVRDITNFNDVEIKYIFSDYGLNSSWVKIITKYEKKRPKIIHYPHSPQSYESKGNLIPRYKLLGDMLLVGRKKDELFFSNFIEKKKIYPCGIPRYDKWWQKKILENAVFDFNYKSIKKYNIITFAYVSKFETFKDRSKEISKQLYQVMSAIKNLNNTIVIFKIHPRKNSKKFLSILNKFDKKKWLLSKTHLTKLSKISKALICHPNSAAGLDALSQNIPTIQLWPIEGIESKKDMQRKLGFVEPAKNLTHLKKLIELSIKNPKHKIWKKQRRNFKMHFPFINKYTKTLKKEILRIYE